MDIILTSSMWNWHLHLSDWKQSNLKKKTFLDIIWNKERITFRIAKNRIRSNSWVPRKKYLKPTQSRTRTAYTMPISPNLPWAQKDHKIRPESYIEHPTVTTVLFFFTLPSNTHLSILLQNTTQRNHKSCLKKPYLGLCNNINIGVNIDAAWIFPKIEEFLRYY